nr:ATP synthase CF0 subunit IV [Selaginella stauntoniana]
MHIEAYLSTIIAFRDLYGVSGAEAGQHSYRQMGGLQVHGQVLITPRVVITIPPGLALLGTRRDLRTVPSGSQNIAEYVLEFPRDLARTRIGEGYRSRVPFIGTMSLFISVPNRSGAPIPRRIPEPPHGELAAPTNDINTTVAPASPTPAAHFYAGLRKKGSSYFGKHMQPTPILLPINILEDSTKPPSPSSRLLGNILADESVVAAPIPPVPPVVPIPTMLLGLFTSAIQAPTLATPAAAYTGESMEDHH